MNDDKLYEWGERFVIFACAAAVLLYAVGVI